MPAPRTVYFAHLDAYQRIHDEACESPGRETGGILVGRMFRLSDGLHLVIVAASGPGTNADRRVHTYAPDTTARQRELDAWRQHYADYQVDYVGEWHKHPPGLQQPSSGDTLQVVEILSDKSYHLPNGIFTPLVTIEAETFLLHGYYYPRETMRPTPVACESVDGEIRALLDLLVTLEQEATEPPATPASVPPASRWGVDPEALRSARANLAVPTAEVIRPDELPDEGTVIDLSVKPPVHPATPPTTAIPLEVPPFPGPPPAESIPSAPPLPGRAAREQSDLEQFCKTSRARGRLARQLRDDGGVWYRVTFENPLTIDVRQLEPTGGTRQTLEGRVVVGSPDQVAPPTIVEIQIDPGDAFPGQPPEVNVLLSDGRKLHIFVARLFPIGWRSHIRLRDVLRAVLDALTQPRAPQQIADLLEFHGRLIVRQVEGASRTVADLCAEFNRTYRFQQLDEIGELETPQQGA